MSEEVKYRICRLQEMPQTDWKRVSKLVRDKAISVEYEDMDYIFFTDVRDTGSSCEKIISDYLKEFKGKGLEVRVWYLEREPDDVFEI